MSVVCFFFFVCFNWQVLAEEEEDGVPLTRDTVMLSSHLPSSLIRGVAAEIMEEDSLARLTLDRQEAAAEMQTFHRTGSLP